jgi:hypothetical protein
MFPIEPPGIPIPIDPVDMPIVVPLESTAVPTHVPVTAETPVEPLDVEAPAVGLLGVGATVAGLPGVDALPLLHAASPTASVNTIETDHKRIGGSNPLIRQAMPFIVHDAATRQW